MHKRPENLPFPHVWSRFERQNADGSTVKFKIQDTPTEMYEELMDFMMNHFMRDEVLNRSLGIAQDDLAVKEFYKFQRPYLDERLSLICILDEDEKRYDMINNKPEIVGYNIMTVNIKGNLSSKRVEISSTPMKNLLRIFDLLESFDDAFERFKVNEYLGDAGLSVNPKYRGMGIASELFNARIKLAEAYAFELSATIFTSIISQRVAEKARHTVYQTIPYSLIEEKLGFDIVHKDTDVVKLMACRTK